MFRAIVIDDESWALLGIRNAFEWEACNFKLAAEYTDAEEALEYICRKRPDVVFTDIRMPKYNGIDIMRKVRELDIDTEFVVISGHAEFAYVQEALKLGALDYCLKPINTETTSNLLEKLNNHLKEKQSLKGYLLMEALAGKNRAKLKRLDPDFFSRDNSYWYTVIVISNGDDFSIDSDLLKNVACLEISMNSRKKLYITKGSTDSGCREVLLPDRFPAPVVSSVGISSRYGTWEDIPKLIREADIAARQCFVSGQDGVFFYKDEKKQIKPLLDKLQYDLKDEDFSGIFRLLDQIEKKFGDNKLGMSEAVYLWNQVIGIIINHYRNEEDVEGLEYLNHSELCDRFQNLVSMTSFFREVFQQLSQKNYPAVNSSEISKCFQQLVQYIDGHYAQELYIKDLSERYYLNQFTCCKLFKKTLGKTFTEYITDIRIDKACHFIRNTDMTIEEIALKVGYSDYFYFNRVFKKHCGITPAKYKRN